MSDSKTFFCFGYGYSCDYIAHDLMQMGGWNIAGTTRDIEKKQQLKARGFGAFLFDDKTPLTDPAYLLRDVTHILISTPPNDRGDPVFNVHGADFARFPNLQWVGYLSTTGVYGDRGGEWVDETTELRPTSKRGSRRRQAEEQWLSLYKTDNVPVHIFRLAGIYGPGRSALDSVRAGLERRIYKEGHAFSRIHVEDIAGTILASIAKPSPGSIYNVCDDAAAPSHEVIEHACELLGRSVPPMVDFTAANLTGMTRSFYMDNRRVKNDKIKNELGLSLKYSDFRAGLKGCLDAESYAEKQAREDAGAAKAAHNPMSGFKS